MSLTYIEIPITSSTTLSYAVPFPVIDESYIHVFIDGVELVSGTGFTVSNSNALITLTTAPTVGALLLIRRQTKADSKLVDFQADAILTEADLDLAIDQVFNLAQESKDRAEDGIVKDFDGRMDAQNRVIKNVANGVAANDALTKGQIDVEYPKIEVAVDNIASLTTVAANLTATPSSINDVAASITAINTVAQNLGGVNQAAVAAAAAAASAVSASGSAGTAATSSAAAAASALTASGYVIPSQTGNEGKFLGTDGTSATWEALAAGVFYGINISSDGLSIELTSGEAVNNVEDFAAWHIGQGISFAINNNELQVTI